MNSKIRFFAAALLIAGLITPGAAMASEVALPSQLQAGLPPSGEMSQETNELRTLGLALSSGKDAMRPFRGSPSKNPAEKDRLNTPIAGMECYIDRIASYISCYRSLIDPEAADTLFTRLIDELQAVLLSERWIGIKKEPGMSSVRSYTYEDRSSSAHIDIDIIARMGIEGQNSYMVSAFAWPR